jgi:microcompartment protein CcmK/EutM
MQIARVIGDVVCTRKDGNLTAMKLMVLQPLAPDGSPAGRTLVAVDAVGAGVGETVFFVRGKEASFPFHPAEVPTDAGIVGIVDSCDLIPEFQHPGEPAARSRTA